MPALRLILGDQLTRSISSLDGIDLKQDVVLMCEVMEEATYVPHHPKKIAFLFSAMRHFAQDLRMQGISVRYVKLDDTENTGSFNGEVKRAVEELNPNTLVVTEPGEYRVLAMMQSWQRRSVSRLKYGLIIAFWRLTKNSMYGQKARNNCVWSFSIARCEKNMAS